MDNNWTQTKNQPQKFTVSKMDKITQPRKQVEVKPIQKQTTNLIKNTKESHYKDKIDSSKNNVKELWNLVGSIVNPHNNEEPQTNQN